jgi:hypothetical protein
VGLRRQVYTGGKRNVKGLVSEDRCIQEAGIHWFLALLTFNPEEGDGTFL